MSVPSDSLSLLWRLQPAAVQVLRACYYSNSVRHLTPPTTPYQVVVSPVALEIKRKLDVTFSQTVSDISIQLKKYWNKVKSVTKPCCSNQI